MSDCTSQPYRSFRYISHTLGIYIFFVNFSYYGIAEDDCNCCGIELVHTTWWSDSSHNIGNKLLLCQCRWFARSCRWAMWSHNSRYSRLKISRDVRQMKSTDPGQGFLMCCSKGDICLEDGICQWGRPVTTNSSGCK